MRTCWWFIFENMHATHMGIWLEAREKALCRIVWGDRLKLWLRSLGWPLQTMNAQFRATTSNYEHAIWSDCPKPWVHSLGQSPKLCTQKLYIMKWSLGRSTKTLSLHIWVFCLYIFFLEVFCRTSIPSKKSWSYESKLFGMPIFNCLCQNIWKCH